MEKVLKDWKKTKEHKSAKEGVKKKVGVYSYNHLKKDFQIKMRKKWKEGGKEEHLRWVQQNKKELQELRRIKKSDKASGRS